MFFLSKNRVRMHDTDMAGRLYFARQFRFAHDALEEFLDSEGWTFERLFHKEASAFVIVHAEADYYKWLQVGDLLDIQLNVEHIGVTSFTIAYKIYRDQELVGTVKTVHVSLDNSSGLKISIPDKLRLSLEKYIHKES